MPLDDPFPRPLQRGSLQSALQFECGLLDVQPLPGRQEAVEHHPFLHRRQRVDVLHLPPPAHHTLQRCLVQLRQREVGRRISPCPAPAVLDQTPQRFLETVRHGVHRPTLVHRLAVRPGHSQSSARNQTVHFNQVGSAALYALCRANGLGHESE